MNVNLTLLAFIEIVSSLTTGVIILYITYVLLRVLAKKRFGLEENNTAFRIFMSGVFFAVGHMINGVIQPMLTSFRLLNSRAESSLDFILSFMSYSTIYVVIAYLSSILISLLGISFYQWLTPINEFKEIKNDNWGVALVTSVIIIILSLMAKDGVVLLIESIIPYPELPEL